MFSWHLDIDLPGLQEGNGGWTARRSWNKSRPAAASTQPTFSGIFNVRAQPAHGRVGGVAQPLQPSLQAGQGGRRACSLLDGRRVDPARIRQTSRTAQKRHGSQRPVPTLFVEPLPAPLRRSLSDSFPHLHPTAVPERIILVRPSGPSLMLSVRSGDSARYWALHSALVTQSQFPLTCALHAIEHSIEEPRGDLHGP